MSGGYRRNPLPRSPAIGRLVVTRDVLSATSVALQSAGSKSPPHEGLVFWLGRECEGDVLVLSAVHPTCASGPRFVTADEKSIGEVARRARANRLGIVAQVHSHGGEVTEHSDGDDELVLMPFEGMYSVVIGRYGFGSALPDEGLGLHQWQSGRWVSVTDERTAFIVVDSAIRL
jgi:hypothetical protein